MNGRLCLSALSVLILCSILAGTAAAGDVSLIGWWPLDGDTEDYSGYENHGTAEGDPTFIVGQYGSALDFDGNDYMTMDGVTDDFTDDDVTMTAWIKTTTSGEGDWFSNNAVSEQFLLCILSGDIVFYEGGFKPGAGVTVNDGEWHHVVAVRDNMDVRIYVDGVYRPAADFTSVTTFAEGDRWSLAQEWDGNTASDFYTGSVDDARIYDRPLTDDEIQQVMQGRGPGAAMELSGDPNPDDGAIDIPRDAVLTWKAGEFAATHDVYLGTSFEDVNTADRANPLGVLMSQGQADAAYDPEGVLDFGQTYYWRVDEVNAVPTTIFRGEVWSFTVEPFAYPVAHVTATTNASPQGSVSPANTVNGSGLNSDDEHSTVSSDMWLGLPDGAEPIQLQYDFDLVYKLHQMVVWNYNVEFERMLGFGIKDVTVEYSENGTDWITLGDVELAQATARPDYTFNTAVDFGGVPVKSVRLTVNSGWGPMGQYGLSEVRFLSIPVQAREPQPIDGAAGVDVDTLLSWRAGREAVSHEVYYGTDAEALALVDTVSVNSVTPGVLDLGTTYYWRVDEVNEADAITTWEGDFWSFVTQEYLVVDDFESYNDEDNVIYESWLDNDEDNVIYESWLDGWVNETGSTVGYLEAPFAEKTIVHGGSQSMPLFYDNAGVATSEAELELAQNWSASGIQSLSLYFRGDADNTGGQLYLKINNTKISYNYLSNALQRSQWIAWTIDLSSVGVNLTSVTSLTVGVEGGGASGVVYVDDIRLYPQAVEMIEPVLPDDGDASLLGAWKLDDGNGTTATDASGNNRHGTLMGGPQWVAGGAMGGALEVDGVDDYVVLDTISYGDGSSADFSVALWVRTNGWDDDSAMISNKDWNSGSNPGWAIAGGAGNNGSWQWNYSDGQIRADFDPAITAALISTGEWYHLCVTHDREGLAKFYYGGQLIGESDISAITGTLDADLPTVLGTDGAEGAVWAYWFLGAFDEVRIYDRVISEAEILGLAGITGAVPKPL